MRTILNALLALCAASSIGAAQSVSVAGVVFADANANGTRDRAERGIAGVAVSNQDAVVTTDSAGVFDLPGAGTGIVFVSVPDGYRSVGPFWRSVDGAAATLAFALAPVAPVRELSFVHASDTHISAASVERTRRLRALVDSLRPAFVVITGDLVRDALRVTEAEATGYFELFAKEASRFATPVWTVPGNHEIFGIERHLSLVSPAHPLYGRRMYRRHLGPDYYSFTRAGVHYIGLNTVDADDLWYYGHIDSTQLAWLERDLALVRPETPVVTFNHIPFYSTFDNVGGYREDPPAPTLIRVRGATVFRHTVSNAADVLGVLRRRRHVLALGGHIHAVERIEYGVDGVSTRFNQTSAVVAPTEVAGLRFPSGITLYTVRDGVIDAGRFIPLGAPETPRR